MFVRVSLLYEVLSNTKTMLADSLNRMGDEVDVWATRGLLANISDQDRMRCKPSLPSVLTALLHPCLRETKATES